MAHRYVLSNINLNRLNRIDESQVSQGSAISHSNAHTPNKDLQTSMHSLSRTKSPTKIASRTIKEGLRMAPYEELEAQYKEVVRANRVLKAERDQFLSGYQELKYISQREKTQLCQAFEELKLNYNQLHGQYQSLVQYQETQQRQVTSNISKETVSAIVKLSSDIELSNSSEIRSLKDQNLALSQDNQNIRVHIQALMKELISVRGELQVCEREKSGISYELEEKVKEVSKLEAESLIQEKKDEETHRRELVELGEEMLRLGLESKKDLDGKVSKLSILMEENQKLIQWKQNLEVAFEQQAKALTAENQSLKEAVYSFRQEAESKDHLLEEMQTHMESLLSDNQQEKQQSNLLRAEVDQMRAEVDQVKLEANEIKQRASQEYKQRITQMLDKAFL